MKVKDCETVCLAADGKEAIWRKIGIWANRVQQEQLRQEIVDEKKQGKLFKVGGIVTN